jgi:hypothetical protein
VGKDEAQAMADLDTAQQRDKLARTEVFGHAPGALEDLSDFRGKSDPVHGKGDVPAKMRQVRVAVADP